ncbi:hypothetical protein MMC15_007294 [Xylographa vitiligo]|nr:hypothetical protein [Xylographa vitiligo]
MKFAVQQQHHHPALDHILDILDSVPPESPTLSPSVVPTSSTQPTATSEIHATQPLSGIAEPFLRTRPASRTPPAPLSRAQHHPTPVPAIALPPLPPTAERETKLHPNGWHARALPFRPKPRCVAPTVRYPPLSAQDHPAAPNRWVDSYPQGSSDDDDDDDDDAPPAPPAIPNGRSFCSVRKAPHAGARPAPSKMALAFITQPSPAGLTGRKGSQHSTASSNMGDTTRPAPPLLFEAVYEFGGGKAGEVMPELRETVRFARRESENQEDREWWRWALGEEEWMRWEMLRVEEGEKDAGGGFEGFEGLGGV